MKSSKPSESAGFGHVFILCKFKFGAWFLLITDLVRKLFSQLTQPPMNFRLIILLVSTWTSRRKPRFQSVFIDKIEKAAYHCFEFDIFFFVCVGSSGEHWSKREDSDPPIADFPRYYPKWKVHITKASRRPMTRQERHLIAATHSTNCTMSYPPLHAISSTFKFIVKVLHLKTHQLRLGILRMTCSFHLSFVISSSSSISNWYHAV